MFFVKSAEQFSQSRNDDYSDGFISSFELGKTDHDYVKTKYDTTEDVEFDKIFNLQEDNKLLPTAATHAAIMKIESELKLLCSRSLQVHNRPINQITIVEPSIELPFEDNLFLEEIFNNPQLLNDFPVNSYDKLLSGESAMTFKDITDMNTDPQMEFSHEIAMNVDLSSTTHDETTNSSSGSSSDENERDEINRRGLKKSGGPLRKMARFGNKQVIKYSNEYHDRRVKNNEAVKKSRLKAKEKQKDTESKMTQLARENRTLNDRVDLLLKELQVLKSLYRELNHEIPSSAVKALERVNVH